MSGRSLSLELLDGSFAVARLDPGSPLPEWADGGAISSTTRTADELSVVCESERLPEGVRAERDWRCLKVAGPLDFSEVGILADLTAALAHAGISLFALSTYDTDYLLVRAGDLEGAVAALRERGHLVHS